MADETAEIEREICQATPDHEGSQDVVMGSIRPLDFKHSGSEAETVREISLGRSCHGENQGQLLDFAQDGCYMMTSDPSGYALVIKNDTFKGQKEVFGMDNTVKLLGEIFEYLNIEMEVQENLTGQELFNSVSEFAARPCHAQADCCALVIISHGYSQDRIVGTDTNWCYFQKLKDLFNSRNAIHLAGKPKLFIIEACRGSGEDEVCFDEPDSYVQPAFADVKYIPPKSADMLIINATTPGDQAIQNDQLGGFLVPHLHQVFRREAATTDALKMLTKVNSRVSEAIVYDRETKKHYKAMSSIEFTLRKDWYFAPYWRQRQKHQQDQ